MLSEMRRLRELEEENGRLKRLVADLGADKEVLQEVVGESSEACAAGGADRRSAVDLAGVHEPRL